MNIFVLHTNPDTAAMQYTTTKQEALKLFTRILRGLPLTEGLLLTLGSPPDSLDLRDYRHNSRNIVVSLKYVNANQGHITLAIVSPQRARALRNLPEFLVDPSDRSFTASYANHQEAHQLFDRLTQLFFEETTLQDCMNVQFNRFEAKAGIHPFCQDCPQQLTCLASSTP